MAVARYWLLKWCYQLAGYWYQVLMAVARYWLFSNGDSGAPYGDHTVCYTPTSAMCISKPTPLEQPCEVKENTGFEVEVWLPSLTEDILGYF